MNIWANCDNCKHDDSHSGICDDCYATRPPSKWEPGENYEPPTNAERIRAMSDEELAKLFEEIGYDMMEHRAAYWLNWLREPAKEV